MDNDFSYCATDGDINDDVNSRSHGGDRASPGKIFIGGLSKDTTNEKALNIKGTQDKTRDKTAAAMEPVSTGPRYAPEDPTLPKPWRGLVDGKTGYLYFWNPETNVTQYERPLALGSAPLPKPPPLAISSKVQVQKSYPEQQMDHVSNNNNNDFKYERSSNGYMKSTSDARNHVSHRGGVQFPQDSSNNMETVLVTKAAVLSGAENTLSVEAYLHQHEITISGHNVPPPLMSFDLSGFPPEILKEVKGAGFSAPTPIQAQAWPIAMQRRDVVAVAKTGSGKTLGYLFPGFVHLKRIRNDSRAGPTVLVLSPTRELATQIQDEASKFGRASRISCTCLYGGAPKGPQLRDLERGVDIVVATPGRLNDILEMRRVNLKQVSYLVLDEADRMLDMGFEPQIRKIVNAVPSGRQTLMFTATWPKEVRKIAADLLNNPVQVNIGNVDELVANKSITQNVEILTFPEKNRRLEQILRSQEPGSKVIVFCSTKKMCDQIARNLARQFGASAIHGDKTQGERDHVLAQFRSGRSPVLVATDVAARGLDIKDIRAVVNFDFPTGIEDYVHRIGRTGRAGATGLAYTFISDQDGRHASDLVKVLEGADQRVPSDLRALASRGGGGGRMMRRWRSDGGRSSSSAYGGSWGTHSSSGRSDRGPGRSYDSESRDRERHDGGQGSRGGGGGGGRERSRSRSNDRYEGQRPSFHMSMMDSGGNL